MPGHRGQWAGRWGPGCEVKKESVRMQGVAAVLPGMDNAELMALFAAHPDSVFFLLKATAEEGLWWQTPLFCRLQLSDLNLQSRMTSPDLI